jgi:hypothetical protein
MTEQIRRFTTYCPRCGKTDEVVATGPETFGPPVLKCGDCLFNDTEVVGLELRPLRRLTKHERLMKRLDRGKED